MNKSLARQGHYAANRLIRLFSVDFTYQLPEKDDVDEAFVHHHGWSKPVKRHEPIVPVNSQTANNLANAQEGTATNYQFIWISRLNVPMKTKVTRDAQQFTVIDKGDYRELMGIYVYYLKGRSDLNAKV